MFRWSELIHLCNCGKQTLISWWCSIIVFTSFHYSSLVDAMIFFFCSFVCTLLKRRSRLLREIPADPAYAGGTWDFVYTLLFACETAVYCDTSAYVFKILTVSCWLWRWWRLWWMRFCLTHVLSCEYFINAPWRPPLLAWASWVLVS